MSRWLPRLFVAASFGMLAAAAAVHAGSTRPTRPAPVAGWVETPVGFAGAPARLTVDAASGRVLVAGLGSGRVVAFDAGTLAPTGSFGSGTERLEWLAATPGADRIFMLGAAEGSLEVADGAADRPVRRAALAHHPAGLALQPLSNRLFVSGAPRGTVVMLDAAGLDRLGALRTGRQPTELLVNPQTDRLYVADALDGTLTVVDASDLTPLAVLEIGSRPHRLALDTRANRIYVTDVLEGALRVVDGDRNRLVARIEAGRTAAVAVDSVGRRLFVTDPQRREVAVIQAETHRRLDTIRLRDTPSDIALDAASGRLWLASRARGTLTVLEWKDPAQGAGSAASGQ